MTDVRAQVTGLWRGREIRSAAALTMSARGLVMVFERGAELVVPASSLDGCVIEAEHTTLYLAGGDVLDLAGDDTVRVLARQLADSAATMPELMRGLREFGDARDPETTAHDRWFAPLLKARRAVAGLTDPARQVAVMDAGAIGRAQDEIVAELAAQRAAGDPARERAIVAMVEEETAMLRVALTRMALTAAAVEGAATDTQLAEWRVWVDAVQAVFRAADEAWTGVRAVLQLRW